MADKASENNSPCLNFVEIKSGLRAIRAPVRSVPNLVIIDDVPTVCDK